MTKTTELWNPRKDIKGISEFTGKNTRLELARALLKYQDEKFAGKLFIPWKKFKHPELGEGVEALTLTGTILQVGIFGQEIHIQCQSHVHVIHMNSD